MAVADDDLEKPLRELEKKIEELSGVPGAAERAAEIALRTQHVIAEETGVADTIDPLGGSWFVEEMTNRIEAKAEEMFEHIDRMGDGSMLAGVLRGIEEGWFQSAIADSAYEFEKALNSGERVIVGVNKYVHEDEEPMEILRIGREVEEAQCRRIAEVRSGRDESAAQAALRSLAAGADGDANLMGLLVDAARARATLGEMTDALLPVFGAYREPPRV